jgi:hypothetical protein
MMSKTPPTSSGVAAGTTSVKSSIGPKTWSPRVRQASTCSGTTSTRITSSPARFQ